MVLVRNNCVVATVLVMGGVLMALLLYCLFLRNYGYHYGGGSSVGVIYGGRGYEGGGSSRSRGGSGRSRGGGGRGGGGGGRGGCFDPNTIVWAKNETQPDQCAKEVMVKDLVEGDLVDTVDLNKYTNEPYTSTWTRIIDVTLSTGNWNSHSFVLSSGHRLIVTSPHLMVIWKDGVSYFVRADQVQVGDVMKVGEILTQVTVIKAHLMSIKVGIETEDGTIKANGVLASGLCDDNSELFERVINAGKVVKNYKSFHFGDAYNTMCMDTYSWKRAYMINNGYSALRIAVLLYLESVGFAQELDFADLTRIEQD